MQTLNDVLYSPYFGVVLSILTFEFGVFVSRKVKHPIANPLLIAVVLIVAILEVFHIPMEAFQEGGNIINLFLAPATAALAVPIYKNLQILKEIQEEAGCKILLAQKAFSCFYEFQILFSRCTLMKLL